MKLKPKPGQVVIKQHPTKTESDGGIILQRDPHDYKNKMGDIVATNNCKLLKVGQIAIMNTEYANRAQYRVKIGEAWFIVMPEIEVLAFMEGE